MQALFRLLSLLPLWLLHGLGLALGWLVFGLSATYRAHFVAHARQAGLRRGDVWRAVGEAGKQMAELPRLWRGRAVPVRWTGEQALEQCLQAGRGIMFLTPHLGAFEVAPQAYAQRYGQAHPVTVLYRPPRKRWLTNLVQYARQRPGMHTAPTTAAGVKQLIKALRRGECVGILPDQVPPLGQGVWTSFFGRPAYTMTLSARLAQQTGAAVLLAWVERLSWGRGYVLHVQPLEQPVSADLSQAVAQINRAMEVLIAKKPSQYGWGYARYKAPRENP